MCSAGTCSENGRICAFVMATRRIQLKEFPSCSGFTLCVVQEHSLCRLLRFWHEIMATVSRWHQNLESQEAPRHGQCAARLRSCIAAVIFHIKGHDLTFIVSQVGGVLMSSRMNVHVLTDASFWGPPAWDRTQLCLDFIFVFLPVHLLHLQITQRCPNECQAGCQNGASRFLYPGSIKSVVPSRITTAEGPS